jgi:hypothetical protein
MARHEGESETANALKRSQLVQPHRCDVNLAAGCSQVYSRGTISALGHVCKELGSEFLRPLQAYPMHLDVSTVEALIDMQMRVRKLNLEAKAMDNSEGMLQSVLNALKLRHSDMLGTLPSSIGNEIPSTPATETSPGNLLADSGTGRLTDACMKRTLTTS